MKHYNLTTTTLSDKLSVPKATISHLMSERNKPSLEFIIKLHKNFPELNLNWLIHQEGVFISDDRFDVATSTPSNEKIEQKSIENNPIIDSKIPENKLSFESNEIDSIVIFYKNGSFKQYNP